MQILRVPTLDVPTFQARARALRHRLEAIDASVPDPDLAQLLDDAVLAGLAEEALARVEQGLPSLDTMLDARHASLDWALACAQWEAGRTDAVVQRSLALAEAHSTLALDTHRSRIVIRAAWAGVLEGEEEPRLFEALQRIRERVRDEEGPTALLADLAHLDAYRDLVQSARLDRALEGAALAAELYRLIQEPLHECKARVLLARADAISGRLQSAAENARRAVDQALVAGHPHLSVLALNALGTAMFRRGEWPEARRAYEQALRVAEAFDERRWKVAVLANRARLIAWAGDPAAAWDALQDVDTEPLVQRSRSARALIHEYRGQVRLLSGEPRAALEEFDRCETLLAEAGVNSYETAEVRLRRAEALLLLEQPQQAHVQCEIALDSLVRTGQLLERGHLLRVKALAAAAMGRPSEAKKSLDEAEIALRRVGDRFELARCLLDRAEWVDDDHEQRAACATEAAHLADLVGAVSLADRAREISARISSQAPRGHAFDEAVPALRNGIVAASPSTRAMLSEATTAARSDAPVLLLGETGTGKEVIARFVHQHSARSERPFVPVNCAAIPESLFEREFFGHVRGAFTGADRDTTGLVEAADGGTLFLDEIGEMPQSLQPKLLRLLQEGTFRRVGDTSERSVDLRIVAATNRSLFALAQRGEFREDLYWRLSWFEFELKPLRQRSEDVVELVRLFLSRASARQEQSFWLDRDAWKTVRSHSWPGNARQLESAIASACARAEARDGGCVRRIDLPSSVRKGESMISRLESLDLQSALQRRERELILEALHRNRQSRSEAARTLGIGRNTLYEKMRKLGIKPELSARPA